MLKVGFLLVGLLAFTDACGLRYNVDRNRDQTLPIPELLSLTAMITKYEVLPKEQLAIILAVGRGFNGWILVRVTSEKLKFGHKYGPPVGWFLKSHDKKITYSNAATVEISTVDQEMDMVTVTYQAPSEPGYYIIDVCPKLRYSDDSYPRIPIKVIKVVTKRRRPPYIHIGTPPQVPLLTHWK